MNQDLISVKKRVSTSNRARLKPISCEYYRNCSTFERSVRVGSRQMVRQTNAEKEVGSTTQFRMPKVGRSLNSINNHHLHPGRMKEKEGRPRPKVFSSFCHHLGPDHVQMTKVFWRMKVNWKNFQQKFKNIFQFTLLIVNHVL